MPVRERTSHERPTRRETTTGLFHKSDSGEKPHKSLLSYASKVTPQKKPVRTSTKVLKR